MSAVKVSFFALVLLVVSCQATSEDDTELSEHNEGKGGDELLPLLFLLIQSGAPAMPTLGVCLLNLLSLGVIYLFSLYA